MKSISVKNNFGMSDTRVAAVSIFVILNLAVFIVRSVSVWRYGTLFTMQGGEAAAMYPVWKVIHNVPAYGWPLSYPFSLALYNYLFYDTYACFLRVVGAQGADMMMWGRLLTPVFALGGAIAQWKLVQHYLSLRGLRSVLSFFFAVGLWVCTSIVRSYALSIRPDMAAIAMVMIALWFVVRQPKFWYAYAGIAFYLAWAFKETVILAFVGVCLFLLFQKRWKELSLLVMVFAVLAAITIFAGTPEYRFNTLVAPRLVKEFSLRWALQIAPKSVLANSYWILAPIAILLASKTRQVSATVGLLTVILVIALAGGLAGMTKVGAWDNYLLEAFVAGSTLLQIAVFCAPGPLVNALVLLASVQPSIQLATSPSGPHQHPFGTVGIATKAECAEAAALRDLLAQTKKPMFTPHEVFSLPWYSSDNHAPALIVDPTFHDATAASCHEGCFEGMLQRGEIPTVMLGSNDRYQSSLNPKYKKIGEAREAGNLWSIYAIDNPRQADNTLPPDISHGSEIKKS